MKKSKNFMDWNNDIFVKTIKNIDKNIIITVMLDITFYFMSALIVIFWFTRIQDRILAFNLPNLGSVAPEQANILLGEVRSFYYLIIFSFILVLAAIIFLASIFKGIIWAKVTKTKPTMHLISKFLVLNVIWMGFWFLLLLITSLTVMPPSIPAFILAILATSSYLTNNMYPMFMNKPLLKTIMHSIKFSIKKIKWFILPYAVIFLTSFIIVRAGIFISFQYSAYLLTLLFLIFLAFVRYYSFSLVKEIK
jgi:hypothetical protein